jgi:ABC-type cobalt transport system substrate-binding protein
MGKVSKFDKNINSPVIAGVEITTDAEGRFNLNALHKASGFGASKAPAQWLRTQQAKELIEALELETMQICIVSKEGRNGGTFGHEILAVEYAGWVGPAYRILVNRTFIAAQRGEIESLPAATRSAIGGIVKGIIHKELTEVLPQMVEREVAASGVLIRRGITAKEIWDRFNLPPKLRGTTNWLGNRLSEMGCSTGKADRGSSAVRTFDPDLSEACMKNGLLHKAKVYASERMGQGKFKLIGGAK